MRICYQTVVKTDGCICTFSLDCDMQYRKVIGHAECLDCIVPSADNAVRVYCTFCLASVQRFAINGYRIVRQYAFLGNVPSGVPLKLFLVCSSVPVSGFLVSVRVFAVLFGSHWNSQAVYMIFSCAGCGQNHSCRHQS